MAAARKTTSTTSTAKADDTSTAKAEETKSTTSTAKAEDTKAEDTKSEDTKSDATVTPRRSSTTRTDDSLGADTNDDGQLPQDLSATDPVVTEDHQQASRAAKTKIKDVRRAARVQVSQFDTSTFARSPLDALAKREKDSDEK